MNISTIFERIRSLFFADDSREDIQKAIKEIELKQIKLKDTLTNLIFQELKLKDRRQELLKEALEIKQDLEDALQKDLDELSLNLIEKIDLINDEEKFLNAQIEELSQSILEIKGSKKELEIGAKRYKDTLITLDSKQKALNAHKAIKEDINSIKSELNLETGESALTKIKDKIHLLNAQMSQLEESKSHFDHELKDLRKSRMRNNQVEKLKILKANLKLNKDIIIVK